MSDERTDLIATLRYDECDEGCEQPCKLSQQTRDKAAALLERDGARIAKLEAERDKARAELAEAQLDAKRYRWLRESRLHTSGLPAICIISFDGYHIHLVRDEADKLIDAAIAKEQRK